MIEIAVLFFVAGNFFLQSSWWIWSYKIHNRKHFTDSEAASTEIDLIHSIQSYVDAKVENELIIKARDKEWSEFMKIQKDSAERKELEDFVPYDDFKDFDKDFKETEITEDPNAHLERDEKGNFNPAHIEGALDGLFDK